MASGVQASAAMTKMCSVATESQRFMARPASPLRRFVTAQLGLIGKEKERADRIARSLMELVDHMDAIQEQQSKASPVVGGIEDRDQTRDDALAIQVRDMAMQGLLQGWNSANAPRYG